MVAYSHSLESLREDGKVALSTIGISPVDVKLALDPDISGFDHSLGTAE